MQPLYASPGRLLREDSLSGGPDGRGWGGAVATDCGLGVTTEHPTKVGFRVTMHNWAKGAAVRWEFDSSVELLKHWGPVRAMPQNPGEEAALTFRLKGEKLPSLRRNRTHSHRTDQWGFVLTKPYEGRWRQSCSMPPPPPSFDRTSSRAEKHGSSAEDGTSLAPPPPSTSIAPSPATSNVGSWVSLGLSKLSAAAAAVGLASTTTPSNTATGTTDASEQTGRGAGGRRGGRGGQRTRARRRRQRQKHRHGL